VLSGKLFHLIESHDEEITVGIISSIPFGQNIHAARL
jgi:hypothetical protein